MSNTDSFIEEVTEEVRRDELYRLGRRYGWIAGLVVVGIIGGAIYVEWSKARTKADAEAFGGALTTAIGADPADQVTALAPLVADDASASVLAIFAQAEALAATGDTDAAMAALDAVISDTQRDVLYRDLAVLKQVTLPGAMDPQTRIDTVQPLIDQSSAFFLLAVEQRALAHVELGDLDAAHSDFALIIEDQLATTSLIERSQQMIVATGGTLPAAATLVQPAQGN